jgi:hypothetical protein
VKLSAVVLALVCSAIPAAPSSAAGGPVCQGLAATITGTPGATVSGTSGADVIVSNGAARVDALGGDDLICTTNTAPRAPFNTAVTVLAGPGDDVVDRTGDLDPSASSVTGLDGGADTYLGNASHEIVNATDVESDVIRTGGGDDLVGDGHVEGGPDLTGDDDVDLGEGNDTFDLRSSSSDGSDIAPGLAVSGGEGRDVLDLTVAGQGTWLLDAPHREATFRGVHAFGFDALERYNVASAQGSLRFIGTAADESVQVYPSSVAGRADLGAGDDTLQLYSYRLADRGPRGAQLVGGPGTDSLEIQALHEDIRLSLVGRRLDYRLDNTGAADNEVLGFEDAWVAADDARITGDAGPNTITWHGCPGRAEGGNGSDVLRWLAYPDSPCDSSDPRIRMYGNKGDDLMLGSRFDDVLIGGPGSDGADGLAGRDRCRAEVIVKCERP